MDRREVGAERLGIQRVADIWSVMLPERADAAVSGHIPRAPSGPLTMETLQ